MEVTPEYSFVRLNDDDPIPPCGFGEDDCLPLYELDDLRFQIITDYAADQEPLYDYLIALPCESCSDYSAMEVFDLALANGMEIDATNDEAGFLKITLTGHITPAPEIGNAIFIRTTNVDILGYWTITDVDVSGAGDVITTDAPFSVSGTYSWAKVIYTPMFISGVLPTTNDVVPSQGINAPFQLDSGDYAWTIGDALLSSSLPYADGACFRICVYHISVSLLDITVTQDPGYNSGECVGTTNCFNKISNLCYNTKITYGNNEDSFGFYTDGTNPFEMTVRLPFWLFAPKYPGDESGYQLSTGQFQKLSERINKTWELETDWKTDPFHQRLRIALSCDNIEVTNENAQLTDVAIYRNSEYSIEWDENVKNYPFAKGTTTVYKQLLSRSVNSNCV